MNWFHHLRRSEQDEIAAHLKALVAKIERDLMATMQAVLDDLNAFAQEVSDYIAARDAADATLKQQLADALAAGSGVATQAQVDAAFTAAEAVKAQLAPPATPPTATPPTPPAGTTGATGATGATGP